MARPLFGKLGTTGRDGSPHVTPIWYSYENGKFMINTAPERVKSRNMKRDQRVSFLVDDGYDYVMVKGTARASTVRDPQKDIEALAVRYHGKEKGEQQARDVFQKMRRITFEITPESVVESIG